MRESVLIVAEAGVNHNGDLTLACELVDAAVEAGADVVKFQAFSAQRLSTQRAKTADYQRQRLGTESQREMLSQLELDRASFVQIADHCRQRGIAFCATPFDIESADELREFGMPFWKVASGELTNLPLLKHLAAFDEPVVLSTGMAHLYEVGWALHILQSSGLSRDQITVLHCSTEYPAPFPEVNLRAMQTMAAAFGTDMGYSDHTVGIEVAVAAVALGAKVIEKHLTTDKTLPGPDHAASLDPQEFRAMVGAIRNVSLALGSPVKSPGPSEQKNLQQVRKGIVARRAIVRGERFSDENLTTRRPAEGLNPLFWDDLMGIPAWRDFQEDEPIR